MWLYLNDLETLLQLVMLLAKYGNSVIVHDVFRDELAGLLAKSGSEDKFFKRFSIVYSTACGKWR